MQLASISNVPIQSQAQIPTSALRNPTLDIARGLSILLVVFAHSGLAQLLPQTNQTIALFRMPFFFFLAGVCLSQRSTVTKFIKKKSDTLLKPYAVTVIAVSLLPPLARNEAILTHWYGGLYGTGQSLIWTPLWFLTHLWLASVLAFILFTLFEKKINSKSAVVSVLLILLASAPCLLTLGGEKGWPWSLDLLPISLFFMLLGRYVSTSVKSFTPHIGVFLTAFALVAIAKTEGAFVSLNHREYTPLFWASIAALSGIYCLLSVAYVVNCLAVTTKKGAYWSFQVLTKTLRKILEYLGTNSLFILLFHSLMLHYGRSLLDVIGLTSSPYLFHMGSIAISVTFCITIKVCLQAFSLSRWLYFPTGTRSNSELVQRMEKKVGSYLCHTNPK